MSIPNGAVITPSASITRLPPELIDHVLTHVPPELLQRTALSLYQVFPDYGISIRHLWTHLIVHRAKQLLPLWRRLQKEQKKDRDGMIEAVRTFCMDSWTGDADILNNVLRCLPAVPTLLLNIGTNFAPEHLEEVFEDPRFKLSRLEVRFRPYVEQASYYQFLKGSYFDSAIETMYRHWPEILSFTHLSIIQDVPPRRRKRARKPDQVQPIQESQEISGVDQVTEELADVKLDSTNAPENNEPESENEEPEEIVTISKSYTGHGPFPYLGNTIADARPRSFAQPIVFFDIKCLWKFGTSPVARHLTHLRLRVPSRDVASVLILHHMPGYLSTVFPSLRYLDISTTNVRLDSVLSTLLRSYANLEHLVLDRTNLFGFGARDKGSDLCKDLGSLCVSAGLARGKEREKRIALWDSTERARIIQLEDAARQANQRAQTDNGGRSNDENQLNPEEESRRALEAAQAAEEQQAAITRSRRGHRSAAQATFSLRDRPRRGAVASSSASTSRLANLPPSDRAYFVLPPLPRLKSMSIGGEAHALPARRVEEWERLFHLGWIQGLERLSAWAHHVSDRYERALRKADEWQRKEQGGANQAKGRSAKPSSTTKPPLDVRLFRFPEYAEIHAGGEDPTDPTVGLIEVKTMDRSYIDPYLEALDLAEAYQAGVSATPPCVLCTVPDCEGPARRGADGQKVDETGGMTGQHRRGCGHQEGIQTWGWRHS